MLTKSEASTRDLVNWVQDTVVKVRPESIAGLYKGSVGQLT
jgi:hypothetical protein